jgi:hypothetical protein
MAVEDEDRPDIELTSSPETTRRPLRGQWADAGEEAA